MSETPLAERAADLMRSRLPAISPDALASEASALMAGANVSALPVVDSDGRFLGMLRRSAAVSANGATVRSAMAAAEVNVAPEVGSFEAISLMLKSGLDHLPVIEDGRYVGIISRQDVIRTFEDG